VEKGEVEARMSEGSKVKIWMGRGVSLLVVLFLVVDAVMKFVKPAPVLEACAKLGLPLELITPIGVILLICTLLYVVPRTAALGAVLLTGYLGGAVAIHLRAGDQLWSHALFPVYVGILAWLGFCLRDARARGFVSL
jgi:hypothetical protein